MADRTSAALFGRFFKLLMQIDKGETPPDLKAVAKEIYAYRCDFDFAPYQMEADDALKHFGLGDGD